MKYAGFPLKALSPFQLARPVAFDMGREPLFHIGDEELE